MLNSANEVSAKRKSINLTIREDIIQEAKTLDVNASRAAEAGINDAIRKVKEQQWLSENREAIATYNERIAEQGPRIKPMWLNK